VYFGDCGFSRIELFDTTDKSTIAIKTGGKAVTSIGDINVNGSLKSITAKTTDLRGGVSVSGSLGTLTLNDIADEHTISIGPSADPKAGVVMKFSRLSKVTINSQTPVKTLSAAEWLGGALNSPSAKSIKITGDKKRAIAGDLNSVKLTLNCKPDSDMRILALGILDVKAGINNSQVLSTGHIGTISTVKMVNSCCFAGVAGGITGLPPAEEASFEEKATIKKITIKGIEGEDCVINSNIAASQILNASLAYLRTENGGVPFGMAADYIQKLTIEDDTGTESWKELHLFDDACSVNDILPGDDAQIRLY
jgi:hypothetical protein